jgi:hypothetical protein
LSPRKECAIPYEIPAYDVDWECPLGHMHLRDVYLIKTLGTQTHKSVDELLEMAAGGDEFWIESRDDVGIALKVTCELCACRTGYQLNPWVESLKRPQWQRKHKKP